MIRLPDPGMKNGLHLTTGNRLELLVGQLAHVLAEPPPSGTSPFEAEQILVQSLGMSRWLSLQLAQKLGICMNCEFPFPQAFFDTLLADHIPGVIPAEGEPVREALAPERVAWQIYHLLPGLIGREEFAAVGRFLQDGDALKRFQLSQRLANLFDQYLVYRPEMMLRWERGEPLRSDAEREMGWQAILWREINAQGRIHFAAALEALRGVALPPGRRLSVFGISSLPPAQVEVLFHLAKTRPVHLFLLSPSQEYFGDDLTPRQRARRGITKETGNPLLTSFGRLHSQFVEVLLELDDRFGPLLVEDDGRFLPSPEPTLLGQLQRDLLSAREPEASPEEGEPPLPEITADGTLEIHGCHSPMREVEVLYDQLLARLEADPTLTPRDILVMAPDIEGYAPYIHAVFGNPEEERRRIPYSVADRHPRLESSAVDLFLRLLDLVGSRCGATEVFALLESEGVARRFAFSPDDLAQIREWIATSGIRWGIDEHHRQSLGLPALRETTWRAGLDRLLLGMAIRGENERMTGGILPVDDVEGDATLLLGRFAEAVEQIAATLEELASPRPLSEWPEALERVVDRFFGTEEREEDVIALRQIREALGQVNRSAAELSQEEEIPFTVMKEWVHQAMAVQEQRGHFLTGGVTFCALKPMRSVPARVIWLLGMGEGAFPRKMIPMQFDLMAREWKLGDRTVREDDRYLFLEALISARGQLGISYQARSEKSHEVLPPSIVVSELLDYLQRVSGDPDFVASITTDHPLQAFSPRYFTGPGPLFSYSRANAAALLPHPEEAAFLRERRWPELEGAEERQLTLEALIDCLTGPAAYLLRRRMSVRLPREERVLEDSEPISLDHLSRYRFLSEELTHRLRTGSGGEETARRYTARALLPPGEPGQITSTILEKEVEEFHSSLAQLQAGAEPPLEGELKLGGYLLRGRLEGIDGGGLLAFRPGRLRARDRYALWVRHLFLCALSEKPAAARWLGTDGSITLAPLGSDAASALLEALLRFYGEALTRFVPFFPETSLIYALRCQSSRVKDPMSATLGKWLGGYQSAGECESEPYPLLYPEPESALDDEFRAWALELLEPMLQAEKEGKA